MRWEQLTATELDGPPELPLGLAGAVVRTFDTPEFRGVSCYEVNARTIINRVPGGSRVPFEWTVNPYRGCTHACVYCLSGDTPILMADGRTRPLAELQVGDEIYGTTRIGAYRRYVTTPVLAQWSTTKPGYRVRLEDGTNLIASGEHRFLTDRGWKYVTGAMSGRHQRPYLTVSNRLIGTGGFSEPPKDTADYRRGYLCGLIRGDSHVGSYQYARAGSRSAVVHRFRLALTDGEALERARSYLGDSGIPTWPAPTSLDWHKGFLAGIFDAEGSVHECLRITNGDPEIIERITAAMDLLDLRHTVEPARPNGVRDVRLLGGTRAQLKFWHLTDPAITRKRSIAGRAVKHGVRLRVTSVEATGLEIPMYDITTGTGDFIANGVVSHNCFARQTHTYLDFDAGRDFDTRLVVKVNAPELLRRELAAPRWTGAHIAMGTNVDCYQRAEGRYRLMPGIIEALTDFANPFSILTKGTLILRDLELLERAAEATRVRVAMSIGFVDEKLWRSVEPGAPSPRRRLDAVRALADAGFACGVLMAPILPGITDTPTEIERTVAAIAAAGAASVTPLPLHLRTGAREWYLAWLHSAHPELVDGYQRLYARGAYSPDSYQRVVTARVRQAARRHGLAPSASNKARRGDAPARVTTTDQLTLL